MAQTCCLLGVVAILEFSASRSEQANGQTSGEALGSSAAEPVSAVELEKEPARSPTSVDESELQQEAAENSERLRRIALGLTAALVTAHAFWPSEPDLKEGAGGGLYWLFVVFVAFGLASPAASLVGGRFRFRWSWTDAAVCALMGLVAISAFHAFDRRPAINLAWEWVGPRLDVPLGAQPAEDAGRVVGAGRRHGGDGVCGLGLWPVSGRRSSCR